MSDDDRRAKLSEDYGTDPLAVNRTMIERYRSTGGDLGGQMGDKDRMLLLTTRGARTGQQHTAPVMYRRDGDRLVVFASNAGAPRTPGWYHNLVANPVVTVEVGSDRFPATAAVTEGEERERLWKLFPFPEHEERAGRQIPVVALTPRR